MFKCKQFDPESFDGKIIKCTCFANLNALNLVFVSKIESWGNLYYETVKLGTQTKIYEQNYNRMILGIEIKYIGFILIHAVNQNK